jgi:hypothetical protein
MENQTVNPNEKNKNSKALLYTIIGVLVALNAGLLYMWKTSDNENQKKAKELSTATTENKELKEALSEADFLLKKLREDSAMLAQKGEALSQDLEQRKNELASMVAKMRANGNAKQAEIDNLKRKNSELVAKIEELEKKNKDLEVLNQQLDEERSRLQTENEDVKTQNTRISEDNAKMRARLISESLKVEPLKRRMISGKEAVTYKAKDVESIRTTFKIAENTNATSGEKIIYVKITGPGGTTLTSGKDDGATFDYEGQQSKYTYKLTEVYDNSSMTVKPTVWRVPSQLKPGGYTLELYCDGFKMGGTSFTLK